MSKTKKRASRSIESRAGSMVTVPVPKRPSNGVRLSTAATDKVARQEKQLANLGAFLGYMFAVWLIVQSANNPPSEPIIGYRWSPAVLGLVVAAATALLKNERNIRSRLRVFDPDRAGRIAYSVAWSVLALIAIGAVMTIPRY